MRFFLVMNCGCHAVCAREEKEIWRKWKDHRRVSSQMKDSGNNYNEKNLPFYYLGGV